MKSKMTNSLDQAANYIFKLHATILELWRKNEPGNISIYPVIDGAYITSRNEFALRKFIAEMYSKLCRALLDEPFAHWYLVRASVAYGSVIHGRDIPYAASYEFMSNIGYKEHLLLGEAMVRAYTGEHEAAPMGVYLDKSASDQFDSYGLWRWYRENTISQEDLTSFLYKLNAYYNYLFEEQLIDSFSNEKKKEIKGKIDAYFPKSVYKY